MRFRVLLTDESVGAATVGGHRAAEDGGGAEEPFRIAASARLLQEPLASPTGSTARRCG